MTRTGVQVGRDVVGTPAEDAVAQEGVNEVRLVGRMSVEPQARELPSGDVVVQLRVVVTRPPSVRKSARATVDTIDVACWSAAARRSALRQHPGDLVEVLGSLRRRFFRSGVATQSRYEVEASSVRRFRGD